MGRFPGKGFNWEISLILIFKDIWGQPISYYVEYDENLNEN